MLTFIAIGVGISGAAFLAIVVYSISDGKSKDKR